MQKLHSLIWKARREPIFHIIYEIHWNLSSFDRRSSINRLDHWKSLDNALVKTSIKGHNTFGKSKQGSNLLTSSHDLGSKYAYNIRKPKAKFWLLPSLLIDENTKYVFFKRKYVYWRYIEDVYRLFTNNKNKVVFTKEYKS